jgi:hypothetical protein
MCAAPETPTMDPKQILHFLINMAANLISRIEKDHKEDEWYLNNWEVRSNYAADLMEAQPTSVVDDLYQGFYRTGQAAVTYLSKVRIERQRALSLLERKKERLQLMLNLTSGQPGDLCLRRHLAELQDIQAQYDDASREWSHFHYNFDLQIEKAIRDMEHLSQVSSFCPPEE